MFNVLPEMLKIIIVNSSFVHCYCPMSIYGYTKVSRSFVYFNWLHKVMHTQTHLHTHTHAEYTHTHISYSYDINDLSMLHIICCANDIVSYLPILLAFVHKFWWGFPFCINTFYMIGAIMLWILSF